MATLLHDTGEEYIADKLEGETYDVGLFHDGEVSGDTTAGDDLIDSDDISDITTEPTDGNYARQTITIETVDNASGDWSFQNGSRLDFDVLDSTGVIDAYFVVINFTSDDTSDSSTTDHLLITGNLSDSYDLANYENIGIASGGIGGDLLDPVDV